MKIKKIILNVLLVFLLAGASVVASPVKEVTPSERLWKQIKSQIHFPDNLKKNNMNEKVKVLFKVENQNLSILEIFTLDEKLKTHVEKEFKKIKLNSDDYDNGVYSIDLKFKVL